MATITSRRVIQEMIDNDGVYPGDPQAAVIYEYEGIDGNAAWAVFYDYADNDLPIAPGVKRFHLLWSKASGHIQDPGVIKGGLTTHTEVDL